MPLRFSLTSDRPAEVQADAVILGVFEDRSLPLATRELDEASNGAIRRVIDAGDASGKPGQVTRLFDLPGVRARRVLLAGLGEPGKFDAQRYAKACAEAGKALKSGPVRTAACYLSELETETGSAAWRLSAAAIALDANAYRYSATLKAGNGAGLQEVVFPEAEAEADTDAAGALEVASAIAGGVYFARELGNLPPNVCTPSFIAERARAIAAELDDVGVEILGRTEMQALGMGALLGVAAGSGHPPCMVVLRYSGAPGARPYVLVGKGITFDSGGISIKPGAGMEEMKFDMLGAATVLGAFEAVARLRLPLELVCVVPAVENMPDGQSYRPGDVLTSMSGQTVEIVNTDAEGRLILCDALTYARRFDPRAIVDVATLTGACVVALGKHAHGLMSRDDDLADELLAAGATSLDRAWRLPLWDDYQPQLESAFADMANVGGKGAGAIVAGCFLARYTEGLRWAHLDVAGTAWDEGRKGMTTGRPVGLLVQWLLDRARDG